MSEVISPLPWADLQKQGAQFNVALFCYFLIGFGAHFYNHTDSFFSPQQPIEFAQDAITLNCIYGIFALVKALRTKRAANLEKRNYNNEKRALIEKLTDQQKATLFVFINECSSRIHLDSSDEIATDNVLRDLLARDEAILERKERVIYSGSSIVSGIHSKRSNTNKFKVVDVCTLDKNLYEWINSKPAVVDNFKQCFEAAMDSSIAVPPAPSQEQKPKERKSKTESALKVALATMVLIFIATLVWTLQTARDKAIQPAAREARTSISLPNNNTFHRA